MLPQEEETSTKFPIAKSVEEMIQGINLATVHDLDYIEVALPVFKLYVSDSNSKYFLYGPKGTKIILEGQVGAVYDKIELERKIIL